MCSITPSLRCITEAVKSPGISDQKKNRCWSRGRLTRRRGECVVAALPGVSAPGHIVVAWHFNGSTIQYLVSVFFP